MIQRIEKFGESSRRARALGTVRMSRRILVADLFCGAGGSSTGCMKALLGLGLEMDLMAVNHNDVAIATHTANHPGARHFCVNLDEARPRDLVPGGKLDLLMASPECTHHSQARGGRPISDQSRMSAWHVQRWCTELKVRSLLIENVPEFMTWGPLDRRDRPIPERRGEFFRAWCFALEAIGFKIEYRVLNAANFGDATTRKRFFLLGRSDGEPIRWPAASHAKGGAGGLTPWKPAREVIDWSLPGQSIFRRKKPLSRKTLARILAGAERFGWPEAFLVVLRRHMDGLSVDGPLPSICANGNHVALAQTLVGSNRTNNVARGVDAAPVPTICALPGGGGVYVAQPILVPQRSDAEPTRTVEEPLPSLTTVARIGVAAPLVVRTSMLKSNALCVRDPATDPLATVATETGGGFGLVAPVVLSRHGDNGAVRTKSVDEPLPAATASGAGYLVEPVAPPIGSFMLSQGAGGAPRATSEPVPTIPADGAHALVQPLVVEYHSKGKARSTEEPLGTLTTHDRFGMVAPVTHGSDESARARSTEDPLPTITGAKRGELAFVEPFLTPAFGERPTQTPRTHPIDEPAPTIPSKGRLNLVEGKLTEQQELDRAGAFQVPPGIDILFRMLTPKELARAMSFDDEEVEYEFCGNKTQVTRQIGNAVPVRTASALVGALLADLAERKPRKRRRS